MEIDHDTSQIILSARDIDALGPPIRPPTQPIDDAPQIYKQALEKISHENLILERNASEFPEFVRRNLIISLQRRARAILPTLHTIVGELCPIVPREIDEIEEYLRQQD